MPGSTSRRRTRRPPLHPASPSLSMLRPAPPLGRLPPGHSSVLSSQACSGHRHPPPSSSRAPKRRIRSHFSPTKRFCRQQTPEILHHTPTPPAQTQLIPTKPTLSQDHLQQLTKPPPATIPPTSPTWTFLHLPTELRLLIYTHALSYPRAHALFRRFRQHPICPSCPHLVTPSLLLLCRQITAEALPILQRTPFIVNALPPFVPGRPRPLPLLDFITARTLQAMRGTIELRLPLGRGRYGSGWAWGPMVEEVLGVLRGGNRFGGVRLVVTVMGTPDGEDVDVEEFRERVEMEEEWLERVGVLMHDLAVNNPYWWCPGRVEEEIWLINGDKATRQRYTRSKIGYIFEDRPGDEPLEVAHYPEPIRVFGTGSLVEFI